MATITLVTTQGIAQIAGASNCYTSTDCPPPPSYSEQDQESAAFGFGGAYQTWPIELVYEGARASALAFWEAINEHVHDVNKRTAEGRSLKQPYIKYKPEDGYTDWLVRPIRKLSLIVNASKGRSWDDDEGLMIATLNVTFENEPWYVGTLTQKGGWPSTGTYQPFDGTYTPWTGASTTASSAVVANDDGATAFTWTGVPESDFLPLETRIRALSTQTDAINHLYLGWMPSNSAQTYWPLQHGSIGGSYTTGATLTTSSGAAASDLEDYATFSIPYNSGNWCRLGYMKSADIHGVAHPEYYARRWRIFARIDFTTTSKLIKFRVGAGPYFGVPGDITNKLAYTQPVIYTTPSSAVNRAIVPLGEIDLTDPNITNMANATRELYLQLEARAVESGDTISLTVYTLHLIPADHFVWIDNTTLFYISTNDGIMQLTQLPASQPGLFVNIDNGTYYGGVIKQIRNWRIPSKNAQLVALWGRPSSYWEYGYAVYDDELSVGVIAAQQVYSMQA